ncbi:MAG: ABC transporter permease [Pirellulaceae bacterium]|nr:ABC transporter permease [Pirellulaceae bacterium]
MNNLVAATDSTAIAIAPWSLAPLFLGAAIIFFLMLVGRVPVRYNVRNLSVRWRTTLMTGLAFTLVIALNTVMLAFVNGMYKLTQGSGQPANVLVMSEGAIDEAFSNLGYSDVGELELQTGVLRDEQNRPLASRETYFVVNQPVRVRQAGRPKGRFTQVRGLDDSALAGQVHGLSLLSGGSWIGREGVQAVGSGQEAIQAVVGEGIARELGRDRPPNERAQAKNPERIEVGETFPLAGRQFVVVGVIKSSGSTFDSEVWAKRDIVSKMLGKQTYSSIVLRAADAGEAQRLADFFNRDYTKAAVKAIRETEYFASLAETNKQFLYSIIFVTAIMALGGVFGVMNTMFAAVSQRTRDIGVLRIIGYSRLHVQASFLLESLVLSLAGGTLGVALGSLIHGTKAASIVGGGQGGGKFVVLEMLVSGDIIAVGLLLSLIMGFFGGLIPSIRAMLLRPLESVR